MNTLTNNLIKSYDLICVVGPTASGKSELAVKLAKKYNGEIISADSRQIYRGMDIGSGKVEGRWTKQGAAKSRGGAKKNNEVFVYKGVPHYLIDEASPSVQYSSARFQRGARAAIADILKRGKMPIICGGTGHWIDAVIYDNNFPQVKPDKKLRAQLAKLTPAQMFAKLQELDPARGAEIDKNNPHRLIRALEIVMSTGKPVPKLDTQKTFKNYRVLWLGLNPSMDILKQNITKRLKSRLKIGMIKEVANLHKPISQNGFGLSWKKLEAFGLEYRYCELFLQNKITQPEMEQGILTSSRQYAKRQMTWWKRNKDIRWIDKALTNI